MRTRILRRPLAALAIAVGLAGAAQAETTVVSVEGNNNPFLAGQPTGTDCCSGDTVPAQAPTLALTNFDPTQVITFSALGGFNFGGGTPELSADGSNGFVFDMVDDYGTGISGALDVQANGLVGVFIGNGVPGGPAPAQNTSGIGFTSSSPLLNQIFWIGDGLTGTGSGATQQFFAPTGATRLFLGATDGFGWFNNSGTSRVTISYTALGTPPPGAVPEPSTWAMMLAGFGAIGGMMRRGGAGARVRVLA